MTGLIIILVTVGMMFGLGIERKHPTHPAKAKTEMVETVNPSDTEPGK